MAKTIDLKAGQISRHVTNALKAINDGYFIALPAEHGYVYVVDAFNREGVRAMQVLRGAADGVTAQVAIKNIETANGISRDIPAAAIKLAEKHWPGLLTLVVRKKRSVSFCIRCPKWCNTNPGSEINFKTRRGTSTAFHFRQITQRPAIHCGASHWWRNRNNASRRNQHLGYAYD